MPVVVRLAPLSGPAYSSAFQRAHRQSRAPRRDGLSFRTGCDARVKIPLYSTHRNASPDRIIRSREAKINRRNVLDRLLEPVMETHEPL